MPNKPLSTRGLVGWVELDVNPASRYVTNMKSIRWLHYTRGEVLVHVLNNFHQWLQLHYRSIILPSTSSKPTTYIFNLSFREVIFFTHQPKDHNQSQHAVLISPPKLNMCSESINYSYRYLTRAWLIAIRRVEMRFILFYKSYQKKRRLLLFNLVILHLSNSYTRHGARTAI